MKNFATLQENCASSKQNIGPVFDIEKIFLNYFYKYIWQDNGELSKYYYSFFSLFSKDDLEKIDHIIQEALSLVPELRKKIKTVLYECTKIIKWLFAQLINKIHVIWWNKNVSDVENSLHW